MPLDIVPTGMTYFYFEMLSSDNNHFMVVVQGLVYEFLFCGGLHWCPSTGVA